MEVVCNTRESKKPLNLRIPRTQSYKKMEIAKPKSPSGLAYGSVRTMTSDREGKKGGSGRKRLVCRLILGYTFLDDAPDKARSRREDLNLGLFLIGIESPATLLLLHLKPFSSTRKSIFLLLPMFNGDRCI